MAVVRASGKWIALVLGCILIAGLFVPGVASAQAGATTFSGVLNDSNGNPVSGATIRVRTPGSTGLPVGTATTGAGGSFAMQVAPGTYTLSIDDAAVGFLSNPASGTFDLPDSGLSENLVVPAQTTAEVTVEDASGNPVAGANVNAQTITTDTAVVTVWPGGPTVQFFAWGSSSLALSCTTDSSGTCAIATFVGATLAPAVTITNGPTITASPTFVTTDPMPIVVQVQDFALVSSAGPATGMVSIASPDGTLLTGVSASPILAGSLPPGYDPTTGDLGFQVTGLNPGQSIVVTVQLPAGSDPTNILKLVNGAYVDAPAIATINGNAVTLNLTDGGFGDEDGIANGTIVDPLVPVRRLPTSPPAITQQPGNQSTAAGAMVTFNAAASGAPNPTVLWQVSSNGGATYTPIPGATSPTYSFTTTGSQNGDLFRAVFSNGVGNPATTNPATLTLTGFYVTSTLNTGSRGHAYSQQLAAKGGLSPYKWKALSKLPKGLKLSSTGLLSGTPSTKIATGNYSISVQVTDATKKTHKVATATLVLNLS